MTTTTRRPRPQPAPRQQQQQPFASLTSTAPTLTLTSDAFTERWHDPRHALVQRGRHIARADVDGRPPPARSRSPCISCTTPTTTAGGFTHWITTDLPATATSLPAAVPAGATIAGGGTQLTAYRGACPPVGAAAPPLPLPPLRSRYRPRAAAGQSKGSVEAAMQTHIPRRNRSSRPLRPRITDQKRHPIPSLPRAGEGWPKAGGEVLEHRALRPTADPPIRSSSPLVGEEVAEGRRRRPPVVHLDARSHSRPRAPNAVIQSEAKNPLHPARRPSKHEPIPPQAPLPSRGRGRGLGLPTLDARSHPRRSQPPHKSFVPPSCPSWLNSDKLPLVDPSTNRRRKETPVRDLVFMIDLDNTILDNDGVKKDLEAKMLRSSATPSPRVSGSSTRSSARTATSSTSTNR